MTLQQAREWRDAKIDAHPELRTDILEYWQLCLDEIEDGESTDNEISLFQESVEELLNTTTHE